MEQKKLQEIVSQHPWLMLEFSAKAADSEMRIADPGALASKANLTALREITDSIWYIALRPYQNLDLAQRAIITEERKMLRFNITAASMKALYGHKPGEAPYSYRVARSARSLREIMLVMEELDIQLDAVVTHHFLGINDLEKSIYQALDVYLFPESYRVPRKTWRRFMPSFQTQTA